MRIGIVAPSSNPFVVGGAEGLWWGMLRYLNERTDHVADLVKIPVRETSLPDLVAGYEAFSRLDLSGFDLVISSKYPAWMVSHPNHVVFLQHRCRGYYDWYPPEAGGTVYTGSDREVLDLLRFMEAAAGRRDALPEFFARYAALAKATPANPEAHRHPGPVGRAIIHFLDGVGLARGAIRRYFAIADAVRRRPGYFPPGVPVTVVHHPTDKTGFHNAGDDYFFTVSRFYPSKRIDLLIEAFRRADVPVPFRIAGTGSEEPRLRELAAGDPRIEFLGFVRDEELVQLYARALAVAFVPADEDFGYVTLEAMLAEKPVITTTDSGGPLELVRDGVNGIVTPPEAGALAQAFERVHRDREWARSLGRHAAGRARTITWPALFSALLGENAASRGRRRAGRPRVTVLNAYAVHPPVNGGRYRLHSLYRALARHVDVDLVTLALREEGSDATWVDEGLRELRVARTKEHEAADLADQARAHVPVYDITALRNIGLTPAYATTLWNSLSGSQAVVVSHPYMLEALRRTPFAGRFLHEAHNCEHALKGRMLPETPIRNELLSLVEAAESACCREAALTFATCEEDAAALLSQYGGRQGDMIVIPNGTDTQRIAFAGAAQRRRLRRRLGLDGRPVALFLASGHRPNLEAAEYLFQHAARMPDVAFALVGNAADAFLHRDLPGNVWRIGIVSEEARNIWLEACDVALNPVLYGGGTNLKLLDYFAAGCPVVSTPVGVRGTGAIAGRHVLLAPIEAMDSAIREAIGAGPRIEAMCAQARALVEERFDWRCLADRLHEAMSARGLLAGGDSR